MQSGRAAADRRPVIAVLLSYLSCCLVKSYIAASAFVVDFWGMGLVAISLLE